MTRRPIVHDAESRLLFEEARREGLAAAGAVNGVYADNLADDIEGIERMIERGDKAGALSVAANAMGMPMEDLFGLLPSQTAAGLAGYLNGLIEGSRGQGFFPPEPEPSTRRKSYGRG
jgi:hypothetical protein